MMLPKMHVMNFSNVDRVNVMHVNVTKCLYGLTNIMYECADAM